MSSPRKRNPISTYTGAEKSSYVAEAVQLGNHKQYCRDKNIPYSTFNDWYKQYQTSTDKENWSPISKKNLCHLIMNSDLTRIPDLNGNKYVTTKSGNMTKETLIQFITEVIIRHTDCEAAALFLDSLGYQHNDETIQHCNNNNITVFRIPPNTTQWL